MKYYQMITLKNGAQCCLRNAVEEDAREVIDVFQLTHSQTDYLLSYPDENTLDLEREKQFLKGKTERENEIEILAIIAGRVVGTAGISAVGAKYKVRHRAEFGISVDKTFWGLGIGQALMAACIYCAKDAGYTQLELDVVADNERALAMYRKAGFVEFGRNPKGFNSRTAGFQELVSMRLEL